MHEDDEQQEQEIHLRDYLHVLQKRKWLVLATIVISFSIAAIVSFRTRPQYQSQRRSSSSGRRQDPVDRADHPGRFGFDRLLQHPVQDPPEQHTRGYGGGSAAHLGESGIRGTTESGGAPRLGRAAARRRTRRASMQLLRRSPRIDIEPVKTPSSSTSRPGPTTRSSRPCWRTRSLMRTSSRTCSSRSTQTSRPAAFSANSPRMPARSSRVRARAAALQRDEQRHLHGRAPGGDDRPTWAAEH